MRVLLALCLAAAPALSQDTAPAPQTGNSGFNLMEEGARLVLRGLMTEMAPAMDELEQALVEIGPALEGFGEKVGPKLRQLIAMIDDFKNYDAPVMLPNGDILIRRNTPLAPGLPGQPGPNGEIDL